MSTENEGVVALPEAGVPADQGLASLGLVMQLGGTVFAAGATLIAFMQLVDRYSRSGAMWMLLVLALCVGRSLYHRVAGAELLYGRPTGLGTTAPGPFTAMRRYIVLGLVQSVVVALIANLALHVPARNAFGFAVALALWPLVLAAFLGTRRFRRFATEIPMGEDKGFEGAAILMTVLGVCGALATGTFLVMLVDEGGNLISHGFGVLLMFALVMLLIRSVLHVQAGLSGLRETSLDRAVERANRYANFGVISAFCASGALLLMMMAERVDLLGFVVITGVCWMLLTWPMIVRRFFSDRQFADLLAGDNAVVHRRAPDAGLTGLGWFLLAHAVFSAAVLMPALIGGSDPQGRMWEVFAFGLPMMRSIWWSVGLVTLQAWAGYELIRMSPSSRVIGTLYGILAVVITSYLVWPAWEIIKDLHGLRAKSVMLLGPIAIQFVVPVSTLLLVNRTIAPTARARFRTRSAP